MTALEKYIDDLVSDNEPQDDFPKNESSWEELYDLCRKLIAKIVTLRRAAAQHSVQRTCAKCGRESLVIFDGQIICSLCGTVAQTVRLTAKN